MHKVTQAQCNAIAKKLNERPRKRHNYKTPEELFYA
ncbi:MAG: IS30 family transposase [Oleispira sp.]|jgi:IS30 family transposase